MAEMPVSLKLEFAEKDRLLLSRFVESIDRFNASGGNAASMLGTESEVEEKDGKKIRKASD